ncbi:rhamnulose-1-phosphate aldolase [Enterococcus sp. 22-H-5-01]|uniref:rhamnulose-1-phosphate aldolase n=1 Tax=Enterococcus sp. 22-H-5-01 TaxID=3418555 RepID=UPI003D00CBD9
MVDVTSNLYRLGWDERNGGNVSYLLDEEVVQEYLDPANILRTIPMDFDGTALAGKYFIVTGSGKYFKNVIQDPANNLGLIRVSEDGHGVELLWGYTDGGVPTSELPAHLMSHIARLEVDPENRIVMHCHASHLLAMTFTHELTAKAITRTLWEMCTECMVVFPEGIQVLPWLIPGSNEIGQATAEKMKEARLVLWSFHGVYGAGRTMDETFGLIETAEKAAQIYTYVQAQGGVRQTITDENFIDLAKQFGITPNPEFFEAQVTNI